MISLNQRLTHVSRYIIGDFLVDIGSDHAYLPIYAIENQMIEKAIAGEVITGPYEASQKNVKHNQMTNVIDVRLGDGLSVLNGDEKVTSITICGMGGPLIAKILNEGAKKLTHQPRLILQSNIQSSAIRELLPEINYQLVAEEILEEKGHIYEILVCDPTTTSHNLSALEIKFGPYLLENKDALFYKKWQRELDALFKIKANLNPQQHANRLTEINREIEMIQEVI
ncbi:MULTISPECIES: tRNA (adenine(22)-N(1))-methyltransferase [Staphylococcus]|uniref:tRNA (Adenine(22)-N(1))-methyltransferase TrmK n=1 Tax=Staphylococcus hsinchuensis TaxID=3051183 RepID=A0ABZ3EBJ2_9STAP|nr:MULTISPECIES: tRNA (adenine(22)-N(1))-methyltransferase TrmK [unclassified Staphylococcus]